MKPLHVAVIGLIVVGATAAVWLTGSSAPVTAVAPQKLFPELAGQLEGATGITVSDAEGQTVTLERKDTAWTVREESKYFANPRTVGELLVALSDATQLEEKTANPEFYERLGLRDVSNADSSAVRVSVTTAEQTFDVLLGNTSPRFDGSTFVRKPGSDRSYLVSETLKASTDSKAWLDRQVLDIASDEVQSVKITQGSDSIEILRDSAQSEFDLFNRTEEQALNETAIQGLSRGLAGLMFDDVRRGAAFAVNDYQRKSLAYTLFDGRLVQATLFYKEAKPQSDDEAESASGPPPQPEYWLNVGVRFDEALAQQFAPQPTATADGTAPQTLTLTPADLADRRAKADKDNKKTRMWMYRITSARFDSLNQTVESLTTSP